MATTANQPFGEWNSIFPDPAMTLAAADRLVHHATIFEMNVESYRRRTAQARRSGPGRPANFSMPKVLEASRDNQLLILIVALQVIVEDFSKVFKPSAGEREYRAGILVGAADTAGRMPAVLREARFGLRVSRSIMGGGFWREAAHDVAIIPSILLGFKAPLCVSPDIEARIELQALRQDFGLGDFLDVEMPQRMRSRLLHITGNEIPANAKKQPVRRDDLADWLGLAAFPIRETEQTRRATLATVGGVIAAGVFAGFIAENSVERCHAK